MVFPMVFLCFYGFPRYFPSPSEVITIRSTAFWGSVTVIVPPNVAVEQDGSAILGGFGDTGGERVKKPGRWEVQNCVGILWEFFGKIFVEFWGNFGVILWELCGNFVGIL